MKTLYSKIWRAVLGGPMYSWIKQITNKARCTKKANVCAKPGWLHLVHDVPLVHRARNTLHLLLLTLLWRWGWFIWNLVVLNLLIEELNWEGDELTVLPEGPHVQLQSFQGIKCWWNSCSGLIEPVAHSITISSACCESSTACVCIFSYRILWILYWKSIVPCLHDDRQKGGK